ncbi:MAG TPA: hypothetical protein VFI29_19240 [Hanamia sp.]|nr:hypothetical protein [Hanamia sp.]
MKKNGKLLSVFLYLIVSATLMLFICNCNTSKIISSKKSLQNISIDLSIQSQAIKNIFSDVNVWDFKTDGLNNAHDLPRNYFSTNYPFLKTIQFMTATGGNAERDPFVNPENRSDLTDYKFKDLITALHNLVNHGLKPMIITGNVPLKYSIDPVMGVFGVNVRPPYNYDVYYNYIKALADTLVSEFGINEVKTWSWGVLTEYENKDWFLAADSTPSSTKIAYFKLYDYTVAALQSSIGADNLIVGAHSMTVTPGLWDELDFIDHVSKGVNFKTGTIGTQINFLSASYYDLSPGVPIAHSLSLKNTIGKLRDRAKADGLKDLKYGIDEGRIWGGPVDDNRALISRIVALSFQGASDARMFKMMIDMNADWFSTWGFTTKGILGGVRSVSAHIASLGYKMAGENRVSLIVSGKAKDSTNEINGVCSIDTVSHVVHLMIYNYNDNMNAVSSETPTIVINNISQNHGATVSIKQWTLDDAHGNFWPTWWSDQQARGLSNKSFAWSKYSLNVPANLVNKSDRDYWYSRESIYKSLATMHPVTVARKIIDNRLVLTPVLSHHGVVFFEIKNVKNVK